MSTVDGGRLYGPQTEPFVAERTYVFGTVKYGYGQTREEAERDSEFLPESLVEMEDMGLDTDTADLAVFASTGLTRKSYHGEQVVYMRI